MGARTPRAAAMPRDIEYDFFVSFASADNREGWVDAVVNELVAEHARFTGGRTPTYFLDRAEIRHLSHWHAEIFNKGLARSRFFLAFLSPNYFASEVCRKEWRAWIEQEISLHILTGGAAPIYFVEVPGFLSKPMLPEHEVAAKVAELCGFPASERFATDLSPVVKEARRRQLVNLVQPLKNAGVRALQEADLKTTLAKLAKHIEERVEETKRADASANTVPPYNPKFTGRLDELLELRTLLTDNRAGVVGMIAGIHGLGGIGKSELSYAFAHAYAGVYPGGRFVVRCEYQTNLRDAINASLGGVKGFHEKITDDERKRPDTLYAAIRRVLAHRLESLGSVLLVLDNVTSLKLIEPQETDELTALGAHLHLLGTTRLSARTFAKCLMLGEMKPEDALALLDKFRPFASDEDRTAAESIVKQLGGFALAMELVAAKLAVTPASTYSTVATGLGLTNLDTLAEDQDVTLRRHNHEKRLQAVLGPTLDSLSTEERRVMDYAALLPPDNVPLPWLKTLVCDDFSALTKPGKFGRNRWQSLVDRLTRLGLFTPVEEESTNERQVRVHRLVQELLRRGIGGARVRLQKDIHDLVKARVAVLDRTTNWVNDAWELDPLESLGMQWDGWGLRDRAWLLNQVALHRHDVAQYGKAEPLLRRTLAIVEADAGPDHSVVGTLCGNLGQLLRDTGRLSDAEPLFRRSLSITETIQGPAHPSVALALNNLAGLVAQLGQKAEAVRLYQRATTILDREPPPDPDQLAIVLNNLAKVYCDLARFHEARPLYLRAIALHESVHGPIHPAVGRDLNNLGQLDHELGDHAAAADAFRRALGIFESVFGEHHPTVGIAVSNLSVALQRLGRESDAEPLSRRALAIHELIYGPNHPAVATDLNNLALLLKRQNRPAEARPLYDRAIAIVSGVYGPDHPDTRFFMANRDALGSSSEPAATRSPPKRPHTGSGPRLGAEGKPSPGAKRQPKSKEK